MENWYLLRCKPRQDRYAAKLLENQEHKVYCPLIWVNKSKTLKLQNILEPLFPGYLFIRLDAQKVNWTAIRSTRGIRDFVRFGQEIAIVQNYIIKEIKDRIENTQISPKKRLDLSPGDTVRVTEGCFEGLQAIYQYRSGKDRVMVLINFMGRVNQATVRADTLEAI